MTVTVGDVLKVVAVMQWLDGGIAQNVFSVKINGSGGPFDALDVVDDMEDWLDTMYANITARVSDEMDGSELRVYVYDSGDQDFDEVGSGVWAWNPSSTVDQMVRGAAFLINAKTIDPDVNGKKFIPGLTENNTTDGVFLASILVDFVDFAVDWTTEFVGATSGATFTPGIWSPTRLEFFTCSGTEVLSTIPAYQRRRKQGVGI